MEPELENRLRDLENQAVQQKAENKIGKYFKLLKTLVHTEMGQHN